jgi:NTF2 fold immunity protein
MKAITAVIIAPIIVIAIGAKEPKDSYVPKDGYVPNKDVAIKIAVAVWEPIYGEETIAQEKPFRAKLVDGVWTVKRDITG